MAQKVGYCENDIEYEDGPFVMVWASGYRIEVCLPGHHCPVLPHLDVYRFLEANGYESQKSLDKGIIATSVDWLNLQVLEGTITLQDNIWKP